LENLKQKTVRAIAFDVIGRFSRQGVGFVISILLARLLSPSDFGLLAMVNVVIAVAGVFVGMGLGNALIQKQQTEEEHYGSVFYFNITVGLLLAAVLFALSGTLAQFYHQPEVRPVARVLSLTFIINSFCNVQTAWLRKHLRYGVITTASVASLVTGGAVGVVMALTGYGVWSLVTQALISSTVNNLVIYFLTPWRPVLRLRWKALKDLWSYGIYMFFSGFLDTLYSQLDNLIIGRLFAPVTLGFYYRAKSFDLFIRNYTSGSLMSVLFPVLSAVQDNRERYRGIVRRSFHLLCLVTFLLTGISFLCASDLMALLFGSKWLPSVEYYRIIVLAGFVYPLSALLVSILSSLGNSKGYFRLELLKKLILTVNFIVGFTYGIREFLIGLVIASVLSLVLNIVAASREAGLPASGFYRAIAAYLLLAAALAAGISFLPAMEPGHYLLHLLRDGGLFAMLFLLAARWLRLEGYAIAREEILKLSLSSRIRNLIPHKRKR
jgi:teichuronic acid exporter